jgi:hypothetical protein
MPTQEDMLDVLNLSRSFNQEINEYNRNTVAGSKLGITVINPHNVIKDVKVPLPPPPPPSIGVEGLNVPPSVPMIPWSEAFPDGKPPVLNEPVVAPTPIVAPATIVNTVQQPPKNNNQLEFDFIFEAETPKPLKVYLDEKFSKIENKIQDINLKIAELSELMTRKKKKMDILNGQP